MILLLASLNLTSFTDTIDSRLLLDNLLQHLLLPDTNDSGDADLLVMFSPHSSCVSPCLSISALLFFYFCKLVTYTIFSSERRKGGGGKDSALY